MYASARILVFGHDALLFETRRLILERAGFQVWTAGEVTEAVQILAKEPIDLFILCQSLPVDECASILKAAHILRPDMKNLVMAGETLGLSAEKHDTFLTTFLGPLALIALIQIKIGVPKVTASLQ